MNTPKENLLQCFPNSKLATLLRKKRELKYENNLEPKKLEIIAQRYEEAKPRTDYQKIAFISDLHIPFQHDRDLERACVILENEKPDCIIIGGDLIDAWEISKFDTVPNFSKLLKEEVTLAWSFLSDFRKKHPTADIFYTEGNHDYRVKSYAIRNAPALHDTDWLPNQLQLNKLNIKWIPSKEGSARWTDTFVLIDGIRMGHFDRVNQGAGQTVRQLMMKKGGSFVQGHVHRAAVIYFRNIDGDISFGVENPCLCKDPFYGSINDWQRGLTIIEKQDRIFRPRVIVF